MLSFHLTITTVDSLSGILESALSCIFELGSGARERRLSLTPLRLELLVEMQQGNQPYSSQQSDSKTPPGWDVTMTNYAIQDWQSDIRLWEQSTDLQPHQQ